MAAWSPDQADVGGFSHPKRVEVTVERIDSDHRDDYSVAERNAGTLYTPDATPSEAFPIEVWTFFSDSDLDQLVVDVCQEMGRRELERGRKS